MDKYRRIQQQQTDAINYDLFTEDIIARLKTWESLCRFSLGDVQPDCVEVEFETLPVDLDAFAREVADFCPDIISQGFEMWKELVAEGPALIDDDMRELIDGIDFTRSDYGFELLKRSLQRDKTVHLWWD